jgi:hypothetical protein
MTTTTPRTGAASYTTRWDSLLAAIGGVREFRVRGCSWSGFPTPARPVVGRLAAKHLLTVVRNPPLLGAAQEPLRKAGGTGWAGQTGGPAPPKLRRPPRERRGGAGRPELVGLRRGTRVVVPRAWVD